MDGDRGDGKRGDDAQDRAPRPSARDAGGIGDKAGNRGDAKNYADDDSPTADGAIPVEDLSSANDKGAN